MNVAIGLQELEQMADDLDRAIASGAQTVIHDGKTVSYKSKAEMIATLSNLRLRIAGARPRTVQFLQLGTGDVSPARRRGW